MSAVTLFGIPAVTSPTECTVERTRNRLLVRRLVREWHSSKPIAPPGERVAFIVYAPNGEPVAVAMFGHPTPRLEDQETTLELTRLAHSPYAPRNLGSWALARMRRWIRANMPEIVRLISYHDAAVHDGALYKSDNWEEVYEQEETSHTWTNRPGRAGTEVKHRIKWERQP